VSRLGLYPTKSGEVRFGGGGENKHSGICLIPQQKKDESERSRGKEGVPLREGLEQKKKNTKTRGQGKNF